MANPRILFVSHKKTQCGVYEFGKNIINVLNNSRRYEFVYIECASLEELLKSVSLNKPAAIIYNYHPSTMPWVVTKIFPKLYKSNVSSIRIPQLGIIHEITQHSSDFATAYRNKFLFGNSNKLVNSLFDFYIAADPTLLLKNPLVYKTGRLIKKYQNNFSLPPEITIGSFGFATANKGFEKIVELVQQEFDKAVIRFNIPFAYFGDRNGVNAKKIEENCKALIKKTDIKLIITNDFLTSEELLNFLAKNTVNIFLYEDENSRGISSVIDYALSVCRPVALSNSVMFRHMLNTKPSICVNNNDLKTIIQNGFAPIQRYHDEWSSENLVWDYERIINSILLKKAQIIKSRKNIFGFLRSVIYRWLSLPNSSFTWLRNSTNANDDDMTIDNSIKYYPVQLPETVSLNRILDNSARELYLPTIKKLEELVPKTMAKKIAEANVQQAFVFDTVFRYLNKYEKPKLLCVGSYEDTASMALQKMGYEVEEIDPTQNYYLQEYVTKPNVVKNSYDIIFSTSVIEHDPDDKSFIKAIDNLLAPGGIAIITCDYKENWQIGDGKPDVDVRFYTKSDLESRLLSYMDNCQLVDKPQWNCPNPDFNYLGKYQYTFATFVVKKQ